MSSSSDLQLVFNNALQAYEKQTKIYLVAHPLTAQFQSCDSPSDTLALLRKQVRGGDDRWTSWLDPTVNVLDALSMVLGERISLVCFETSLLRNLYLISTPQVISPTKLIFTGIGVLLSVRILLDTFVWGHWSTHVSQAANGARAIQGAFVDVFERIGFFFRRLESYIGVPLTTDMMDLIIKIMIEVLSILAIATKEIKLGRMSE